MQHTLLYSAHLPDNLLAREPAVHQNVGGLKASFHSTLYHCYCHIGFLFVQFPFARFAVTVPWISTLVLFPLFFFCQSKIGFLTLAMQGKICRNQHCPVEIAQWQEFEPEGISSFGMVVDPADALDCFPAFLQGAIINNEATRALVRLL